MTKEKEPTGYEMLGKFTEQLLSLACCVPAVIFRGYVFQKFWGWFVVSIVDISTPSLTVCIGLMMMVGLFHHIDLERERKPWRDLGLSLVHSTFGLVLGYLVSLFV